MATAHQRLAARATDLEKAMRDTGAWTEPTPPLRPFQKPFAMDSMPFEHWLQLVLVPRIREIAATGAPLPMRSNLAPHAVREWDGRDDVDPVVAVLRAIDDVCPAPAAAQGDHRRLGAGLALIVALAAWAAIAIQIATHVASAVSSAYPTLVIQSFSGTIPPGPELRPLRVTVTAAAVGPDRLRPKMTDLIVLRSMATIQNGPTAPMRFTSTAPPTVADVVAWLASYGAEPAAAERAATEALAIVDAGVKARTRPALHTAAPTDEALVEVLSMTPAWVAPAMTVAVFLLGAVPITWSLLRWAGS